MEDISFCTQTALHKIDEGQVYQCLLVMMANDTFQIKVELAVSAARWWRIMRATQTCTDASSDRLTGDHVGAE